MLLLFTGCSNYGQLQYVAKLPKKLKENSGMTTLNDSTAWLIEDHGNNNVIYEVDLEGKILRQLEVDNAHNHDWEDLTKDSDNNIYIGDFGNNNNKRKNLTIYKIPNPDIEKNKKTEAGKIKFSYPDQKEFPPSAAEMNFDAEAFFYYKKAFFIITKNRTKPFDGEAAIYKVPAITGKHEAQFIGKFIDGEEDEASSTSPLIVTTRHDIDQLSNLTKIKLLEYAKKRGISINSRKRKSEIIDILMRS